MLYKGLKGEPVYEQMALFPKLGVVEINTLWLFRLQFLVKMFINIVSSLSLLGIGMPSQIQALISSAEDAEDCHRLLSSLLW